MSSSSPSDLAVTFRSIPRRLGEAHGDAPAAVTARADAELGALITTAGQLMSTSADPLAIATAIDAVHPEQWDEATLDSLRTVALDIGRLLRHIAALTEGSD